MIHLEKIKRFRVTSITKTVGKNQIGLKYGVKSNQNAAFICSCHWNKYFILSYTYIPHKHFASGSVDINQTSRTLNFGSPLTKMLWSGVNNACDVMWQAS